MSLDHAPALATIALCLAAASPVAAATFTYDGTVSVSSELNPSAVFPPVGQSAAVTFTVDGDPGDALPSDFSSQAVLFAALSVPGFLDAGFSDFVELVSFDADALAIGTPEGMPVFDTQLFAGTFTTYSVFDLTFGSPLAAAPSNVGELIAALEAPGATGLYGFSGSGPLGESVRVEVEFAEPLAPVPLPAGAPFLISALAGLGVLQLRRGRR